MSSREWLRRGGLLAASSLVSFALLEGVVRWQWPQLLPRYGTFEITSAGPLRAFRLVPDPAIGWRMPPLRRFLIREPEFESLVLSNEQGFRSSGAARDGTRGSPVVAFIGDSITEAVQVTESETFVKGVEMRLAGSGVRADNYGVSSMGYPHYLAVYRNDVRRHHPALVVVTSFLVNDLADSAPDSLRIPALRPRFTRDPNGGALQLLPFVGPPAVRDTSGLRRVLRDHCATYRLLRSIAAGELRAAPDDRAATVQERLVDPWPQPLETAWRDASWSLQTLIALAQSDGAGVVVVAIPGEDTGSDSAWRALEALAAGRALDRDLLSRRLEALCVSAGVPYRDLSPLFRAAYGGGARLHFRADGHLTAEGHALVAEALAPVVAAALQAAPGPPTSR